MLFNQIRVLEVFLVDLGFFFFFLVFICYATSKGSQIINV